MPTAASRNSPAARSRSRTYTVSLMVATCSVRNSRTSVDSLRSGQQRGQDDGEQRQHERAGQQLRYPEQPQLGQEHLRGRETRAEQAHLDHDRHDGKRERGDADQAGRCGARRCPTARTATTAGRAGRPAAWRRRVRPAPGRRRRTRAPSPRGSSSVPDGCSGCPPAAGRFRQPPR